MSQISFFDFVCCRQIRVKRKNQTWFFLCDESDSILSLKEKVASAANQHCGDDEANKISAELLRFIKANDHTVVEDDTLLRDCGFKKDDGLFNVILKIADDEWESVEIVSTELEEVLSS